MYLQNRRDLTSYVLADDTEAVCAEPPVPWALGLSRGMQPHRALNNGTTTGTAMTVWE